MKTILEANQAEFGDDYDKIMFVSPRQAKKAETLRNRIVEATKNVVSWGYHDTKVDVNRLSPGCRLCGAGEWSCLFINNSCNGRCFYCPAPQEEVGLPTTQTLEFIRPADYVQYVERFGFKGVSFSGGEPLLTFSKTLDFLKAIKERFGESVYVWLYTNGLLMDSPKAAALADAGLDEIRFDIGATNYSLDFLQKAIGVIPTVTVEIPAVPEKETILRTRIAEMAALGVNHLNLHQLRLTPYNFPRMLNRGYTFLHGDKVTVLESELTALRLIQFSFDHAIDLPVNYCSFVYKHRFQKAAARRRAAEFIRQPWEDVTEAGFIRRLALGGTQEELSSLNKTLSDSTAEPGAWHWTPGAQQLFFEAALLKQISAAADAKLTYFAASMRSAPSFMFPFREVKLSTGMRLVVERYTAASENTPDVELLRWLQNNSNFCPQPHRDFESIPYSLAPYC